MNFDFNHLYMQSDGRIGRQTYWIGAIALGVIALIISLILAFILGAGTAYIIAAIILQLAVTYLAYNLMAKRFHDRDKSTTYALYTVIPFFVLGVISLLTQPAPGQMPGGLGMAVGLITLVIAIWVLIELGIRRGTVGQNQYGPDPVGP